MRNYTEIPEGTTRLFDDLQTSYYITVSGEDFRLVITTFGAFDEEDNESIGWGGLVELHSITSEGREVANAILSHFEDRGDDVRIEETTIYNTAPVLRCSASIMTTDSPDDLERITDEVREIIKSLTANATINAA